jgi:hypothetical protein
MSSRNNNDRKNKKTNDNNDNNNICDEVFPDELDLQPQKVKVKNIREIGGGDGGDGGDDDGGDNDDYESETHSSDQDDSEEDDENNLYDLMTDFFVNDNGENVATVLTNIQASLDQHAKCILKLTKVIQDAVGKNHK